jgi:cytochrome c biogenesis protein CcdA
VNDFFDLPVVWAFSVGMFACVNPCGFAMLPSFIAHYLGSDTDSFAQQTLIKRLTRSTLIGLMVTLGFIVVFSLVGFVVAAGGRALMRLVPWASAVVGAGLVALGLWMLTGRHLPISLPRSQRTPQGRGLIPAFLFGLAYAVTSLSCTLPVFLVVVGSALAYEGAGMGLTFFLSYALGMGTALIALTISTALFKGMLTRWLRHALPYVERASAMLLVVAGVYLVSYQFTTGGLR